MIFFLMQHIWHFFDLCGSVVGLPMYSFGTLAVDMVVGADSIVVAGMIVVVIDRAIIVEMVIVGKNVVVDKWHCVDFE